MGLGNRKPKSGTKAVRLDAEVDTLDLTKHDKQWVTIRLIGPATSFGQMWLDLGKSEETGKAIRFPKPVMGYNAQNEEFDGQGPYQKFAAKYSENARLAQQYLQNVIVRDEQEDYNHAKSKKMRSENERKLRKFPEWTGDTNKYHFKEKGSKARSPIKVMPMSATTVSLLQNLKGANKIKMKDGTTKFYDVDDAKHGADIQIMYDSTKKGTAKLAVMIETKNVPLTEEEMEYLLWDINPEHLDSCKIDSIDVAKSEVAKWVKRLDGEDADEDDEDEGKSKKKKKKSSSYLDDDEDAPKGKKKKRASDDDDDDIDDIDDDLDSNDDDDEDEKPKKNKKKKRASDDDDDDDDDEPVSKKTTKKKKKSSSDDDDDDDDSDDDTDDLDDDDDEDEKPAKKKVKGKIVTKKKKKRVVDDDDDDDDDD